MTVATIRLPTPDWKSALVNPDGTATPYFQRFLQSQLVKISIGEQTGVDISGKVDKATSTGWSAATGTSLKTTFATYTAPVISNPPTQAEVQAIANHVQLLSQHMKALIDAGFSSGLLSS